jgi:hypothetical protein
MTPMQIELCRAVILCPSGAEGHKVQKLKKTLCISADSVYLCVSSVLSVFCILIVGGVRHTPLKIPSLDQSLTCPTATQSRRSKPRVW